MMPLPDPERHPDNEPRLSVFADRMNKHVVSKREEPDLLQTILQALQILCQVPAVVEAVKAIGVDVKALRRTPDPALDETVLGKHLAAQLRRLEFAVTNYSKYDETDEFTELEKSAHRKRMAALTCKILQEARPLKDRIPEYEKLVDVFCTSIPKTLP
jgi:hypothetical protein